MAYNVLGISGSPVKKGNVETFLQKMMDNVPDEDFFTEIIHLSRHEIGECKHCNYCLTKQKPGKYCALKDDAQQIYEKVEKADVIILASPVYFMRTSSKMAALIDRLRVFIFGNVVRGKLKNKIGVSAAVAWIRHGGFETTHLSHLYAFLTLEMIPASIHQGVSPLGASAVASERGAGVFNPSIKLGILEDESGLESAAKIMERAVELAKLTKGHKDNSNKI